MILPGPEAAHHWQGRTLVDRDGEPVGNIERIYKDKATDQPEWALLAAGVAGPGATFVPLVNATEEGDTVRTPFERALFERAPSVPAGPEITEEQEAQLYRHYGVAYSRAESPSGLPTDRPGPATAQRTGETQPLPAMEPTTTPAPAAGPAPVAGPAPTWVDAVPSQPAEDAMAPAVAAKPRISDPRVAAAAGGAALAVAAGIWQRKRIGAAASGLAGMPASVRRRRRERRRVKAFDQAVARLTDRATALGRSISRLLAIASLLPVAGSIEAGRRAWAGAQAAGEGIGQLTGRARPVARKQSRAKRAVKVVAGTAMVSRLAAIPGRARRRRRQQRGATAAKRSLLRGAGQAAMVGSTVGRLLAGAAVLPVASAARGGRRALASAQVARPGGKGGGRRRRGSRGKTQLGTLGAILGGVAGYVLGARAGEERYREILETARRLTQRPEVQRASDQAATRLDQLSNRAADKLQQARRQAPAEPASRPSEPVTATQASPERLP
jgi:hypothetical protein